MSGESGPGTSPRWSPVVRHTPGRANAALLTPLIAVMGFAVSLIGAQRPSYWSDEIATLQASRLDGSSLWALLHHKDAVHGLYYVVMHGWMSLWGESELATRSLSALAVGVTGGVLVLIGQRLGSTRTGVLAGLIFCLLPRTTFMGVEARSYALSAALVSLSVLAFLYAIRGDRVRTWVLFAVTSLVSTSLFIYSALIVLVELAVLLCSTAATGRIWRRWSWCVLAVALLSAPLLLLASTQRGQISWLEREPAPNPWSVLGEPWAERGWMCAGVLCAVVGYGLLVMRRVPAPDGLRAAYVGAAWAVVPAAILLAADAVLGSLYTARYLSFAAPGVALLGGAALSQLRERSTRVLLLVCLMVAAFPAYAAQREPYAKTGDSDLRAVAATIELRAEPGDAFILQNDGPVTLRSRLAVAGYPEAFADLDDVAFLHSDIRTGRFADVTRDPAALGPVLPRVSTLWVASSRAGSTAMQTLTGVLDDAGFHESEEIALHRSVVRRYSRAGR